MFRVPLDDHPLDQHRSKAVHDRRLPCASRTILSKIRDILSCSLSPFRKEHSADGSKLTFCRIGTCSAIFYQAFVYMSPQFQCLPDSFKIVTVSQTLETQTRGYSAPSSHSTLQNPHLEMRGRWFLRLVLGRALGSWPSVTTARKPFFRHGGRKKGVRN